MTAAMCRLPEAERDLIERAAKQSGFDIRVEPATYVIGTRSYPMAGKISVISNEPERDHLPFWEAYRKLRAAP